MPSQPTSRCLSQDALADLAETGAVGRWIIGPDGVRLHALDYATPARPDDRPVLVILPGITMPAIGMDFVARMLADLVRPVVLDVRGRGLSDSAQDSSGYGLDAYAKDVEALIEQLELHQPILLGHSMGARIATATAARAMVGIRSILVADPPMSGPQRPYPTPLAVFESQLHHARSSIDVDEVAAAWPRWPRREQALRARWLSSCSSDAVAATHAGFESENFLHWWRRVRIPAALMYGSESPVVTSTDAAEIAAVKPDAEIVAVPSAGHMLYWDEPEASLAATRELLVSRLVAPQSPSPT